MKSKFGRIAIPILLFLSFFSCTQKNDQPQPLPDTSSSIISLETAKQWALSNLSTPSNGRASSSSNIGTPAWKRVKQITGGQAPGILKIALEDFYIKFGYRDILFQQVNGKVNSVILEIRADSAYLTRKLNENPDKSHGIRYYVGNSDFTGDIIYLNPANNQFIKGWRYANGRAKYNLKPFSVNARDGGPIDNDDDTDDPGGTSDPGWTGTGNNTDGYTIDGPEITAPAPPTHNPPPYIPPVIDPGPIHPPTYPIGGGPASGGGSGPKESPKEGENYEDPAAPEATIPCPVSFNFVVQGNWQSAVIKDYYFEFVDRSVTGKKFMIKVGTIEVGMPRVTFDGSLIQSNVAQNMAAQAATMAENQTLAVLEAMIFLNPSITQQMIDNNPLFINEFKKDFMTEIDRFLQSDYNYKDSQHPSRVSTSQAQFSLKDPTKWMPLKFFGRDC